MSMRIFDEHEVAAPIAIISVESREIDVKFGLNSNPLWYVAIAPLLLFNAECPHHVKLVLDASKLDVII